MKDKLKDLLKKYGMHILLFVFFLWLSMRMKDLEDDFVFKAAIERYGSFFGWLRFYAANWSGRLIPHGLFVLLQQLPPIFFALVNTLFCVQLFHYSSKTFFYRQKTWQKNLFSIVLLILVALLIPDIVLDSAVYWKCATVLYVWGMAAVFVAIYPLVSLYHGDRPKRFDIIMAFFGVIYASGFEQIAAFMTGFMICMLLWTAFVLDQHQKENTVMTALSLVLTVVFLKMPGNSVRIAAEVLDQMPNYDMYTVSDKIIWGITYGLNALTGTKYRYIMLLIAALLILRFFGLYMGSRKKNKVVSVVLIYYLLAVVNHILLLKSANHTSFLAPLFTYIKVDEATFFYEPMPCIATILGIVMFIMLGYLVIIFDTDKVELISFLLYFGGFATMVIMAFSPTIYASGQRVIFVCGFLYLVIVTRFMVRHLQIYLQDFDRIRKYGWDHNA